MNDMCLILKEVPVTEEPAWVELWAMSLIMHADFSGPFPALVSLFSRSAVDQNSMQHSETQMGKRLIQ